MVNPSQQSNLDPVQVERDLIDTIGSFTLDPSKYVDFAFPWGEEGTILEGESVRDWQREELESIRDHLQDPETRFQPYMSAVASGHGIGKSAFISMVVKWALDTCDDTRIIVTANTDGQLKTKTVPEVVKWSRLAITAHWFKTTATSIYSLAAGHDKSWRCDFQPWSADNPEAFAGLHNKGKRIVIIFDEASGIDNIIWETVEGALTDENTEIIWIAFGNPTRNVGRFRECFRSFSKFWKNRHIDSRDVPGTNKKLFERWAEKYGVDSDFFRVRVRGLFPILSSNQLISTKDIEASQGRHLRPEQYEFAPKIICVDPAWTGGDDFVIGMRQGLYFQILQTFPKNDNDVEMANIISRLEDEHDADAVFIDGGYGTGIYSAGKTIGRKWRLVWFAEASTRQDCVNKRTEMAVEARDWMKEGGAIPEDTELYEEAIAQELVATLDGKYKLPPKDQIKEIIGRSPNKFDCLMISFAFPVRIRPNKYGQQAGRTHEHNRPKMRTEYDRYKDLDDD